MARGASWCCKLQAVTGQGNPSSPWASFLPELWRCAGWSMAQAKSQLLPSQLLGPGKATWLPG